MKCRKRKPKPRRRLTPEQRREMILELMAIDAVHERRRKITWPAWMRAARERAGLQA